jgi:hypothetical protein
MASAISAARMEEFFTAVSFAVEWIWRSPPGF